MLPKPRDIEMYVAAACNLQMPIYIWACILRMCVSALRAKISFNPQNFLFAYTQYVSHIFEINFLQ